MALPALLAPAAISLIPSVFKGITGLFQKNKADEINPINPSYQMNTSVIDNATNLTNRANNYMMAGYGNAVNDINNTSATNFGRGIQGATNSGDVLDLATRIAYGQGQQMNNLNARNSQGREQAYLQGINAQNMAGEEYQAKNAWDREQYMQQLREKAALEQSGTSNIYGALDSASGVASNLASTLLSKDPKPTDPNVTVLGSQFANMTPQQQYQQELLGRWNTGLNRPMVNNQRTF